MRKMRSERGSIVVLVLSLAIMVILPIGLYGFEIARLFLAQAQLRSACDAAALAGALIMSKESTGTEAEKKAKAKEAALAFFRRNLVVSGSLADAILSPNVKNDSPTQGKSTFDLDFESDGRVRALASFGLASAFGGMLGIDSNTIRANSLAGHGGLEGDVVIVVDLSGSMGDKSQSVIFSRAYNAVTKKIDYKISEPVGGTAIYGPTGIESAIPVPSQVDFSKDPLFAPIQNAPISVKTAALVEAKLGNLENDGAFRASHNDSAELATYLKPQDGFQEAYQKLAMKAIEPLSSEKAALQDFLRSSDGSDMHAALVTYAQDVSSGNDRKDNFKTKVGHKLPIVNLNKDNARLGDVMDAINPSPLFNSTNTGGALLQAASMFDNSGGHRESAPKTIVLLTDGMPNYGPKLEEVTPVLAKKGIRVLTIGFFFTPYSQQEGPKVLNTLVAKVGNGSRAFIAPDVPKLKDALRRISNGTPTLVNE